MTLRQLMPVTKALADETRVRMLLALRGGELCVCQITGLFGLAPSTISKHLSLLYRAQLVNSRKAGRWMYYALAGKDAAPEVREALSWLEKAAAEDPRVSKDRVRLKKLLLVDPVELCQRQCRS
jgi:ArsR family transcriptional regulator